jgi:dipeptidase E
MTRDAIRTTWRHLLEREPFEKIVDGECFAPGADNTQGDCRMRRLVLYSDQIVPDTDKVDQELVALLGRSNPTVGYIPSSAGSQRQYYYEARRVYYARLRMTLAVDFGLDQGYDPNRLEALLACDAIHLSGGNTYYFLHWLRQRDMLAPLRRYVAQGGVLIGVSAGAILVTPDIATAAFGRDEPLVGETDLAALHLVDFAFVPHFQGTPSALVAVQAYSRRCQVPVYACRDGDGIVVVDDQVKCIGDITVAANGKLAHAQ